MVSDFDSIGRWGSCLCWPMEDGKGVHILFWITLNYLFGVSISETQFFAHSHPQAFFHSDPENFLVFSFKLYVKLLWHPHFFFPFFSIEFERWMMGWMEKKESEARKGKMVWKWRGKRLRILGKWRKKTRIFSNFKYYLLFKRRCLPRNVICLNEKEILLSTKSGQAQIIYGCD